MHLQIRHRSVYEYSGEVRAAMQLVRLTPRPFAGLSVGHWRIRGEHRRPLMRTTDGFGNVLHVHEIRDARRRTAIFVEGEVETRDTQGVVGAGHCTLPPGFFLRRTSLTTPDDALHQLAHQVPHGSVLDRLHQLMAIVRERIDYRVGTTHVGTTARDALRVGAGVCQDHAHVFVTCCRVLGVPARYVSGYLWTGADIDDGASHAWAEAWVDELGWVGFDPANRICPGENYVRTAIGLDYWSTAPIRGIWSGAGQESLEVTVRVAATGAQVQAQFQQ